jgi:CheY-like chemotaxis protein
MEITCTSCQGKFRIGNDQIPPGKYVAFPCPKCATRISVTVESPGRERAAPSEAETGAYNASDRPFDFIEEEGRTALICEIDPQVRRTLVTQLAALGYQITAAENAREALKRMRYHVYDVVVVDELFDTENPEANGVLIYLERLAMSVRRNIFVVMITGHHRTMDNFTGFLKSLNLVINVRNIEDFGKILGRGLTEHLTFYRVFRDKLKQAGRA